MSEVLNYSLRVIFSFFCKGKGEEIKHPKIPIAPETLLRRKQTRERNRELKKQTLETERKRRS